MTYANIVKSICKIKALKMKKCAIQRDLQCSECTLNRCTSCLHASLVRRYPHALKNKAIELSCSDLWDFLQN